MKRVLVAITLLLASACSSIFTLEPDPADAFVGEYTTVDNYFVRWGGDYKSSTLTSRFMLIKLSANQVKMVGEWTTTGTITGNTIRLDACLFSDSNGYVNYTFGVGTLYGNTLSFTYYGTGLRRYTNGVAYPWETSGNVTATKIK